MCLKGLVDARLAARNFLAIPRCAGVPLFHVKTPFGGSSSSVRASGGGRRHIFYFQIDVKGGFVFAKCLFLAAIMIVSSCCRSVPKALANSIPTVRVAPDGAYDNPLLDALSGPLQAYFPSHMQILPHDLPNNVVLVESREAELAIAPVNVAYQAFNHGWPGVPHPFKQLRGIGLLYTIPLHLIATDSSGIRDWKDIRGKRIAIGSRDSTTQVTVSMALAGLGLSFQDIDAHWVNGNAAVQELRAGKVDAVFHRGYDPPSTLSKLLQVPHVRAIPISSVEVERIRALYPFLHPIVVPPRAYGDSPSIPTIGVDSIVVCRDDLPESFVYSITRALFELLATSPQLNRGFYRVDLRRIQATPIPLHPGAIRYYRERELFQ